MKSSPGCPRQELEHSSLPWGKAVLGGSRERQRLLLPTLTGSSQQEGGHPTGIRPGAGLTFWESSEVKQGRETLLDREHQVSVPELTRSPWHYGIQSSAAGPGGKVVIACVTGGVKLLH